MITSTSNPRIRRVVQLQKQAKARREAGVFVVEGRKMCAEAPTDRVVEVYLSESYEKEHGSAKQPDRILPERGQSCVEVVSDAVFRTISDTKTPQGILAVVKQSRVTLEQILAAPGPAHLIVLENLQDPGNLGTILRTAEGAGVTGIILSEDTVDIYNPKVIRSTMGSLYRVPFCTVPDVKETVRELKQRGICCYAAALQKSMDYTEPDYRKPTAFLIGNEGNGLSEAAVAAADRAIRIPMEGRVESLNASIAAGLLMYEVHRQRRQKQG